MNIAIVGATGNVGRKTLEVFDKKNFKFDNLYLVASEKSAGKKISFRDKEYVIENLEKYDFSKADITFFAAGTMVKTCLDVAEKLEKSNLSCSVVNMHTIKPIDKDAIDKACDSKLIVSAEEHNVIGGLGSAIAEYKSTKKNSPKQLFIGINDIYSSGGEYNFLKEKHGLTADKIVSKVLSII